ncbi:hypothetical protein AVEN_272249-1 [Araneus ventricosus]|uniref:Uncharacterized protein n=1 Tax=Araneus ventricosus TaxID=182803 RepID=A0A4Y2V7N4_ARAVE|nr:hypothetical protein AVEN_272249-1 [Araneus ventricosus]
MASAIFFPVAGKVCRRCHTSRRARKQGKAFTDVPVCFETRFRRRIHLPTLPTREILRFYPDARPQCRQILEPFAPTVSRSQTGIGGLSLYLESLNLSFQSSVPDLDSLRPYR